MTCIYTETVEVESDDDVDNGEDAVFEEPLDVNMSDNIPESEEKKRTKRESFSKEFLHVISDIVVYSRQGIEIGRFPMKKKHLCNWKVEKC